MKRSSISPRVMAAYFWPMTVNPWIGFKLAALQGEKWFFNALYPRAGNGLARRIRQVGMRITDLCNLRCRTCGQWGEGGFLHSQDAKLMKADEVSPERYREMMTDLVDHGHRPMMYFWGGEPMLYPGLVELIEAGASLRLPVSIATNGTRVDAAAERLVRAPLFLLQMSIDGHTAALHNRLRPAVGRGDNFKAIESALTAVRRERLEQHSRLPLIASLTTVSQDNCTHLTDIYETFHDRVDLMVFYLSWWIDEEDSAAHEQDFSSRFGFLPTRHRGWIGRWKAGQDAHINSGGPAQCLPIPRPVDHRPAKTIACPNHDIGPRERGDHRRQTGRIVGPVGIHLCDCLVPFRHKENRVIAESVCPCFTVDY